MSSQKAPVPGDDLGLQVQWMKWIWALVFVIVVIFGGVITTWPELEQLLETGGEATLIQFVAVYTLPLTAGSALAALLWLRGAFRSLEWYLIPAAIGIILAVAGYGAEYLGLGLLPDFAYSPPSGLPPFVSVPLRVLHGYLNTHGWGLMISSVSIGVALSLHIDALYRSHNTSTD